MKNENGKLFNSHRENDIGNWNSVSSYITVLKKYRTEPIDWVDGRTGKILLYCKIQVVILIHLCVAYTKGN